MECELMLFVKNHIPYLLDLSNSFSNSFTDFYSYEVVSWIDLRKNEELSFDRFVSIVAVVFKHVSSCQNKKKHKQTLESAQYMVLKSSLGCVLWCCSDSR